MKTKTKVSIIVPIFNMEKWLSRCLTSICKQTMQDFEVILVDDGSTDKSKEICKHFLDNDNRFKYFYKKNGGLSDARNYGVSKSSAKYLVFIDSDDYVAPTFVKKLYDSVVSNNSKIAMCGYNLVTESGKFISQLNVNVPCLNNVVVTGEDLLNYYFEPMGTVNVVAWNKIYSREIFNTIKYPVGRYYEDSFILPKLYWNVNKISLVRECLYNYVQRKDSIIHTTMNLKKIKDSNDSHLLWINFFKSRNKRLYTLSVKAYKEEIPAYFVYLTDKRERRYFQKQFRKYSQINKDKNIKVIIKDILCYISLPLFINLKNIKKFI